MNGPVPTGLVFVKVAGLLMAAQMCWGRMTVVLPSVPNKMATASGVSGLENVNTTVFAPVATTDLRELFQMALRSREGLTFK